MADPYGFSDPKMAAAQLLACVVDLESMGCKALEYRKADPKWHKSDSWHDRKDVFNKYYLAVDMNHDGAGDSAERKWFVDNGIAIAKGHGLAICAGVDGYVAGHSVGDGMHMHLDTGVWTNTGNSGKYGYHGAWHGKPVLPAWPVRAFQKQHGLTADGVVGPLTTKALQKALGVTQDGVWGTQTTKAIQTKANIVVDGILGGGTYFALGLLIENHSL